MAALMACSAFAQTVSSTRRFEANECSKTAMTIDDGMNSAETGGGTTLAANFAEKPAAAEQMQQAGEKTAQAGDGNGINPGEKSDSNANFSAATTDNTGVNKQAS